MVDERGSDDIYDKMSAQRRRRFARHTEECAFALKLWRRYPDDMGDRANELLVTVRGDFEAAMQIYKSIEFSQDITEELFQKQYKPKIMEMELKVLKLERDMSKASSESREAQRRINLEFNLADKDYVYTIAAGPEV